MKTFNTFLFFLALMLFIGYFFITILASFYAITEGWGLSILVVFIGVCCLTLFLSVFIRLKVAKENYNFKLNALTIILSIIIVILSVKSLIGINQEIKVYNTINDYSN